MMEKQFSKVLVNTSENLNIKVGLGISKNSFFLIHIYNFLMSLHSRKKKNKKQKIWKAAREN